MTMRL